LFLQTDHHIGALTVGETLDFAFDCQQGISAHKVDDIPELILQAKVSQ
jgi:ABC-type multidrug transport system ATPase subunit